MKLLLSQKERFQKSDEINRKYDEGLYQLLTPAQRKRYHQIYLQIGGLPPFGRANPRNADAKELGLTDEQKTKLRSLFQEIMDKQRVIYRHGDSREEREKKTIEFAETIKRTHDKALDLLTPEQKAKWKKMIGEPFKGEVRLMGALLRFNQDTGKKP